VTVAAGEDDEDVLRRIIRQVYDITGDDARLRAGFQQFEKLRAEYPVRREFFNTELQLRNASVDLQAKFARSAFAWWGIRKFRRADCSALLRERASQFP